MPGGRPTEYKDEYVEVVRRLCVIGLTDQQIIDYFEVSRTTIRNWKLAHPEFLSASVRSQSEENRMVKASLLQRATGYKRKITKDFVLSHGGNSGTYIESVRRTQHVEADVRAAIRWLEINDPQWRAARGEEDVNEKELNESIDKLIGPPAKQINDKSKRERDADASGDD